MNRKNGYITLEVSFEEMSAISLALDHFLHQAGHNAPFIQRAQRRWDSLYRIAHKVPLGVLEIKRPL